MSIGHPELVAAIASEIARSGPIPFVRFMDMALYHPQFGYYMRHPDDSSPRIGWSGDFYTSADVHPILGQACTAVAFGDFLTFATHPLKHSPRVASGEIQATDSNVDNLNPLPVAK